MTFLIRSLLLTVVLFVSGCAGGAGPRAASAPSAAGIGQASAGVGGALEAESSYRREAEPARVGLATRWGETRHSSVTEVPFERAGVRPEGVATIHYNDRSGTSQTVGFWDRLKEEPLPLFQESVLVGLIDSSGDYLPGTRKGEKLYVQGKLGKRYAIRIDNNSWSKLEVVASVDGLDVMNGRPAAFDNRGYLIKPGDHLVIEGFRKSEDEIAAFRFGEVQESYAHQTNQDTANVGVIGVAIFREKGSPMIGKVDERRLREQANPFPAEGRYATPPP